MGKLVCCITLCGSLFVACQAVCSEQQWDLVKSDPENDINIYYNVLPGGNVQFKGVTHFESSITSFIALFLDFDVMSKWVYRTGNAQILHQANPTELIIYTIHPMPFPFRKRDAINLVRLKQDENSKVVTITLSSRPDYILQKEGLVRVPVAESRWQLTPLDEDIVEVEFTGYGEPGGSISSKAFRSGLFQWLIKGFLWEVPYQTLIGLKQIIHQPKYQNAKFSFITEYYE